MDTLRDRLAELADDAPMGGAPAAELWARGRRAHRLRAAALAVAVLVVGAVGTGVGLQVADGDGSRSVLTPASSIGFTLPIAYPAGEKLQSLGDAPGPLAAVWTAPRTRGGSPDAVGLVAKTGTFGTLPIALPEDDPGADVPENVIALSPDGRWIAYQSTPGQLTVRDLVSGEQYSPMSEFETRTGWTWVDNNHLVGHVAGGSDADGWVWEPGTAPKLVNPYPYLEGYGGRDLWVFIGGGGPRSCSSPTLEDSTGRFRVPLLCDVLGYIGSEFVLGHGNSERLPGNSHDGNGTVIALDVRGAPRSPDGRTPASGLDDPALRHVVVTAGGPERVSFATGLIEAALKAGGAS